MIIDKIEKMYRYDYVKGIKKVIDFLKNNNLSTLENKKYDLGDGDCVKVQEYATKELPEYDIELEAHREYADLQLTLSGEEVLYFQSIELGEQSRPYNKDKDVEFFTAPYTSSVVLNPENFALIFPNDLHMGGYNVEETNNVKKLVFKLLLDEE